MKQNVIDDYNLLSGQQKAAILVMSLDEERSSTLFSLMDEEEIKELSVIMVSLGKVNSNIIEQLIAEFNEKLNTTGGLVGTYESTERLLAKTLDKDKVNAIMEEIRGPAGRTMWDKLGNVNEHVLANYLKNEYPQTIAVILSKIKAEHAAKVIALFPENFAMEIVMRMLRMDSVQKDVMDSLKREAFGVTLKNPVDVAEFLMAKCGFSGHTPHVTAVVSLLVALRNVTGKITDDDIREGFRRGYEIPAGWCGYYGSCGAGVAVGTAFSIALGATPQSDKERSIANFATSVVLKSIAKLGGPCCCVASVRAAMKEAVSLFEKYLGITFPPSERSGKCWASARQAGCRKERCRFFESVNN